MNAHTVRFLRDLNTGDKVPIRGLKFHYSFGELTCVSVKVSWLLTNRITFSPEEFKNNWRIICCGDIPL